MLKTNEKQSHWSSTTKKDPKQKIILYEFQCGLIRLDLIVLISAKDNSHVFAFKHYAFFENILKLNKAHSLGLTKGNVAMV